MQLIDRLFEAFDDEEIDWPAAKALGDICRSDIVFTKSNYAVIQVRLHQLT
jgi:DNA repair/transcription protein MET18/MMS19